MALLLFFCFSTFSRGQGNGQPERILVPKLHGKLTIDGELIEEVWSKAAKINGFVLTTDGTPEREKTILRLWYDDAALYLGFTCADTDIQASLTNRDSKFWEEEVVECFIDPNPKDLSRYYELQWNPLGGVFDAIIHNSLDANGKSKNFQGDWSFTAASMRSAVKLVGRKNHTSATDKLWQVEVRLPFSDLSTGLGTASSSRLNFPPHPGEIWRANFYRFSRGEGFPTQELGWSPTGSKNFHEPSKFGYLEFGR